MKTLTSNKLATLTDNLRKYNAWRRGDGHIEQPRPKDIGLWIDEICDTSLGLEAQLADAHNYLSSIQKNGGRVILSQLNAILKKTQPPNP